MQTYQEEFIRYALGLGVLCFGEFTLKSGRISPYFFNSGLFNDGDSLRRLGTFYAHAIRDSGLEFDVLFGPAYKGIPLAATAAIALSSEYSRAVPYCFDRKEAKDHGEGGTTVGAPLTGRVLIIDDVISAGTSVNHSIRLIRDANATPAGVAIALDRQEKGRGDLSAVQEVEQRHGIQVISIIGMKDLMEFLQGKPERGEDLARILAYRERYGA